MDHYGTCLVVYFAGIYGMNRMQGTEILDWPAFENLGWM